jgi:hypothetical protein
MIEALLIVPIIVGLVVGGAVRAMSLLCKERKTVAIAIRWVSIIAVTTALGYFLVQKIASVQGGGAFMIFFPIVFGGYAFGIAISQ